MNATRRLSTIAHAVAQQPVASSVLHVMIRIVKLEVCSL